MIQGEPEETLNSEMGRDSAGAEDIEALQQALDEEKKKAGEYLANWQRTQADFINYKRRTEQERGEFNKFANATLILNLLPVLDDLERALGSVPSKSSKHDWIDGIRLIERKLRASLESQGISQIKALGEPFDPNFHEALRQENGKEGIVLEELQKGYMIHDRLLRPARVVVGNGEEDKKEEQ